MMRASFPDSLSRRRHSREHQRTHSELADHTPDPAVQRARHAGGPIDRASYTCHCGCVFLAPVSTTVACPHCDATQAW
jgi:hypothetical protein